MNIPGSYRQLYQRRIEQAQTYIDQNLTGALDLTAVARAANFSPYHFHRIFSALVGENLQDYINRLRLEKAANLLEKSPRLSMTEVAFTSGFSSSSVFSRSFKKYYGVSASAYARQPARRPESAARLEDLLRDADAFPLPEVKIVQRPPMHLAIFRGRLGYAPASIAEVWGKMFQWAGARQLSTEPPNLVAVSVDDPIITPPNKCRYYAGLVVPETITSDPLAGFMDFPRHLCAVCRVACAGELIQPTYHALYRQWLPDSGFTLEDLPPYEVYFDAPDAHPGSPYVFDLCVPLRAL